MNRPHPSRWRWIAAALTLLLLPASASAYIGPGAGLSAIGALIAVAATLVTALAGILWYPIRRFLLSKRRRKESDDAGRPA